MKKKMKLSLAGVLLTASLCSPFVGQNHVEAASDINFTTIAANQFFKDVDEDNYAYDAIIWAKNKGIVSGYENGNFGPNDNVTEAQFAKMVTQFFNLPSATETLKKKTPKEHWADDSYNRLAAIGVPLFGYIDNDLRNKPVKRGTVAIVLAYSLDSDVNLTNSINFLIDKKITSGQNPEFKGKDLLEYFGYENNLTRAQVVSFLYRMSNTNLIKLDSDLDYKIQDNVLDLSEKAQNAMSVLNDINKLSPTYKPPAPGVGEWIFDLRTENGMTFNEMDAIAPSITLSYAKQSLIDNGYTIIEDSKITARGGYTLRESGQGEFIYDEYYTFEVINSNGEVKTISNSIQVEFTNFGKNHELNKEWIYVHS